MLCPGFDSDNRCNSEGEYRPMGKLSKKHLLIAIAAFSLVTYGALGVEPAAMVAQASGDGAGAVPTQVSGNSERANPQICDFCFQQLQKDNRDCEALKGQDWQVCREAATTAYNQCSQGC